MVHVYIYKREEETDEYAMAMRSDLCLSLVGAFHIPDDQWEISLEGTTVWIFTPVPLSLLCVKWEEWFMTPQPTSAKPMVVRRDEAGELVCNNLYVDPTSLVFRPLVQRSCTECFVTFASRNTDTCDLCMWFSDDCESAAV